MEELLCTNEITILDIAGIICLAIFIVLRIAIYKKGEFGRYFEWAFFWPVTVLYPLFNKEHLNEKGKTLRPYLIASLSGTIFIYLIYLIPIQCSI